METATGSQATLFQGALINNKSSGSQLLALNLCESKAIGSYKLFADRGRREIGMSTLEQFLARFGADLTPAELAYIALKGRIRTLSVVFV